MEALPLEPVRHAERNQPCIRDVELESLPLAADAPGGRQIDARPEADRQVLPILHSGENASRDGTRLGRPREDARLAEQRGRRYAQAADRGEIEAAEFHPALVRHAFEVAAEVQLS